jgi:hypothetical protein
MCRCLVLLTLILVLSLSCSRFVSNENVNSANSANTNPSPGATSDGTDDKSKIVLSIPVGEGGVSFDNVDAEELQPWGPSAFTSGPDGTSYIVDAVNSKILRFRPDGSQLPAITVANVVLITDITVSDESIYLLDQGALTPSIIHLSLDGELKEKTLLSPQPVRGLRSARNLRSLSGLEIADDNAVLLQFEPGAVTRRLDNSPALARTLGAQPYSVRIPTLQEQVTNGGRGSILLRGQPFVEIEVDNLVAELKVLGPDNGGDVFVVLDEMTPTAQVNIDQTVRRYGSDGTLKGIARVPIREMYTFLYDNVKMLNGEVKAIVTAKNRLRVEVPLKYEAQLDPILPRSSFSQNTLTPSSNCKVTRKQIMTTARKYLDNRVHLTVPNLDPVEWCEGRKKPKYLGIRKEIILQSHMIGTGRIQWKATINTWRKAEHPATPLVVEKPRVQEGWIVQVS